MFNTPPSSPPNKIIDTDFIIPILERHLGLVEGQSSELYLDRLKQVLRKAKEHVYQDEYELVMDLISIGFQDVAQTVRRNMFI